VGSLVSGVVSLGVQAVVKRSDNVTVAITMEKRQDAFISMLATIPLDPIC
jgi:hypothetical protein